MLNSEKIKLIVLAIISYAYLKASGSQSVSQSVSKKFHQILKKKINSNFLKEFQVTLKAYLGLVLSNQYCPIVVWEN